VLGCEGRAYDKARDAAEAREHLQSLAGRTHVLHSAVALALAPAGGGAPSLLEEFVVDIAMPMRALTPTQLDAYLATEEWRGSVGCYKFEGRGALLFEPLTADQSAIIGLPLTPLFAALRRLGVDLLTAPEGPWTVVWDEVRAPL
jgi:septum formation protein